MDAAKLEKLKANVRIGGKGTPRRKIKRSVKTDGDDTKVQAALQKLNAQTLTGVEQVNLFKEDGKVIHFGRPAVQQASQYNTFAINGHSVEKPVSEMLPEMIQSMSPDSLEQLRKLTEQIQAAQGQAGAQGGAPAPGTVEEAGEVPSLVEGESFDKVE